MSTAKTVAGRPVTGDVENRRIQQKVEQKPIEDFVAALDKVFDAYPQVEAVRWRQYTPYFNDGDPCVFSTGDTYAKVAGGDPEGGDYEDGFLGSYCINRLFSDPDTTYDYDNKHPLAVLLEDELGYYSMKSFKDALESAFGDPAKVTATRDGFHVEFYDHD